MHIGVKIFFENWSPDDFLSLRFVVGFSNRTHIDTKCEEGWLAGLL